MSDGKDAKRWWLFWHPNHKEEVCVYFQFPKWIAERDSLAEVMPVTEHQAVVAELKAEIEQLKNERKVQDIRLQTIEPGMEQLDLDLQRTLRRNVKLSETIARQARVIEKLRYQRNMVLKAASQDELDLGYGEPESWERVLDKELAAIERAEGEKEP